MLLYALKKEMEQSIKPLTFVCFMESLPLRFNQQNPGGLLG